MGIIDFFKDIGRRIKGMFLAKNQVEKHMQVKTVISGKMEQAIGLWNEMYTNHPPWEGDVEYGACLNLPAAICSEISRLVLTDFEFKLEGNDLSDFITEQLKTLLRMDNLSKVIEHYCATGAVVLKPYVKTVDANGVPDKIGIEAISANYFYPVAFDDGMVTSAIFVDSKKEHKYLYTRLEMHEWSPDKYVVRNKAYRSEEMYNYTDSEWSVGYNAKDRFREEIPLTDVPEWENLEPEVTMKNIDKPLFIYIKVPTANNEDPDSPLGASIYHRAVNVIRATDIQYGGFLWEYEAKKTKIFADTTMFDEERDENGELRLGGYEQKLFRTLHSDQLGDSVVKGLIEPYSPDIRDQSMINGLNENLRQIEFLVGLAYGTLSHTTDVEKTAEEIRMSKQRSYHTVNLIQEAWGLGLQDLCEVIALYAKLYHICPDADIEPVITWGDGVLQDTEKEIMIRMQLANGGFLKKKYVTAYWMGCTPEEAEEQYLPESEANDVESRFPLE